MIINWLRVITYFLLSVTTIFSQSNTFSYPKQVCADKVGEPINICYNKILEKCVEYCNNGVTPVAYVNSSFNFFVVPDNSNPHPVSQQTSISNSDVSEWCSEITFTNTGTYLFNLFLYVKSYNPFNATSPGCNNISANDICEDTLSLGSILIEVNSSFNCNKYIDTSCNLINNGGFEETNSCPNYINRFNSGYIKSWDGSNMYLNTSCNNLQVNRKIQSNNGNSANPIFPSQPLPSGDGFIGCGRADINFPLNVNQQVNLCDEQRYRYSFEAMFGGGSTGGFSDLGLYTGAGSLNFFNANPPGFNRVLTIPSSDFQFFNNWTKFSYDFTNVGNTSALSFQNTTNNIGNFFFDNLHLTPIDTVIFNTQLIGNRCDSAQMILNIPGCYGPYNLEVVVNADTLNFLQVQDGYSIRIPLAKSNIVEVLSITNNLGCSTILSTKDTLTVQNGGDARFTSSDFCENESNTITFLADTGLFSLVNNGTSSTIDANTGIINNPQVGSTYIIQHAVCLDTIYDTITAISSSSDFTSSDICFGGSNVINITGNTGGIFSLIPPINGATINASTGIVSGGIAGNSYTIQYKVTQGNCPDSTRQTIQVVAIEDPSFTLTDFCVNDKSNRAMVTGSAGGTFSFLPSPMDTATINASNGFITGTSAGTTYTVQYVTSGVCKDSSTQNVTALALPTAYTYGVGGDLCTNDSITVSIALTGTTPWNISYTNGSTINVMTSPYTIYAKTIGDYKVTSVSDASGCVNVGEDSIVKITGSDVQVWSNDTLGCAPQEVRFYTNIAGLNGDCLWDFGDGSPDTNICDSVTHSYKFNGNFAIKLIVSSPKCKDTVVLNNYIKVNPNPQSIFFFTPENPSVLNNRVEFTNNSIANVNDYWYLGNNFVSSIVNPEILLPAVIGNHEVCLEVENTFGCLDTACSQIFVLDESLFYIPNAFIPNNDGLNDVFKPVISNSSKYKMEIFNRWGKMIFETIDETEGWDGTYKGVNAREDLYVYRITYRFKGNFDDQYIQGHFNLLR